MIEIMIESHTSEIPLFKIHQHKIILFTNFVSGLLKFGIFSSVIVYFLFRSLPFFQILFITLIPIIIFFYYFFFWSRSYFYVTNEKIVVKVRNGFFSNFYMSIYYKNIRDLAYSKNNIFHYFLGYGVFFARSSAGAEGDFEVPYIPHVERVYKIINALYLLPDEKRRKVKRLEEIHLYEVKEEINEVIQKERANLLSLQGIKEVITLSDEDRKYIFQHEEEKNHGVYECLRKKVLFCVTHDATFRDPDAPIVLKLGDKIIFPAVSFHEVQYPSTVSASPGVLVHNYLMKKFNSVDTYDATILIGFDL